MPPENTEIFDFIINRRAGEVLGRGEDKVRAEILSRFGAKVGSFLYVEGEDVAASVRVWAEAHAGQNRGLVIGGGDGTLVTAAEQVLGRKDIIFGVLPLGTQNMIARQLGFSPDFTVAATQYKAGSHVEIDVGHVNGMPFLIGIVLDRNSVGVFEAREYIRDKKPLSALGTAFSAVTGFLLGKKKEFIVSTGSDDTSRKIKGRFLAITNNELQPRAATGFPFSEKGLKDIVARIVGKADNSTGELSLYAFEGGLLKTLGIVPGLLRGAWTRSKLVRRESATRFVVQSEGVSETLFVLDGEIKKTQYPLDIRITPKGLRIFRPE